jgi:hypothetical protein
MVRTKNSKLTQKNDTLRSNAANIYIGKFWDQNKCAMFMGIWCIWEQWIEVSLQTIKMTVFWLPEFRINCHHLQGVYS